MRKTIGIDDGLLGTLKEEARRQNLSMARVLDRTLRAGINASRSPRRSRRRCREHTYRMGVPTVALDKALSLAAALEDKEIIRKMMLRKRSSRDCAGTTPYVDRIIAPQAASAPRSRSAAHGIPQGTLWKPPHRANDSSAGEP